MEQIKEENVQVLGARVHNLKNIDVEIPRNKITVITGLSGSGKSSLAFDTIYAEGQRRYIETFSAYARQFLGNMERPDVDKITGLSPVISIEQKTTNKNPRSTVGTITEIYDFLRLLFARASIAYSYETGEKMVKYTDAQIVDLIIEKFENRKVILLAPLVKSRKGHYKELFDQIRQKGFLHVRINGKITEVVQNLKVDRYKTHNIEIVIDKFKIPRGKDKISEKTEKELKRIRNSIQLGMHHGKGIIMLLDPETNELKYYSRQLMCPTTGISYNEPAPNSFSYNSPLGYCSRCKGLGEITTIDIDKIIPDRTLSIKKGAIAPLGKYKNSLIFWQIEALSEKYGFNLTDPIKKISDTNLDLILNGTNQPVQLKNTPLGSFSNYTIRYQGIIDYIQNQQSSEKQKQKWTDRFMATLTCPDCNGNRLQKEALQFKIDGKNISQLAKLDIIALAQWFNNLDQRLTSKQQKIAKEIVKEIKTRLSFLLEVGLSYLSLDRPAKTLSGGESQRIRLATQIGSQLVNVLYILDEPSIGLHQRDNNRLIQSLVKLKENQNTIIVVEHDKDMILAADHIIDIGPGAGKHGGEIIASGTQKEIFKKKSLTTDYLNNFKKIEIPEKRRKGNGKKLIIKGAKGNNLKNIDVEFPLGTLICVTGVSGSGKSTLINETLQPILSQKFYRSKKNPLEYDQISGIKYIDKVIEVDQSPIGRTPRSNPSTYIGVFTDIRKLFANLPESQIRGYKLGRFSFNVKGGRCEGCGGAGIKTIEMNFLPDVYVKCEDCNGRRYNRETLEVRYKGKSISDVLDMTFNQAAEFFKNIPAIYKRVQAMQQVGLGYIALGQPSTTLSGGEAQRIKLAAELSKKDTGKTLYVFDEPTTGLHFEDINVLLKVLNKLVNKGNTLIIIEHNLDVIKIADYIIDLGKEGGKHGGEIIVTGTPEEIIKNKISYTAKFLKKELHGNC